jgi:very-short-patch-repair endonuclease
MVYSYNNQNQKDFRKKLRSSLGSPEIILWQQLKGSKLGHKFRRQYGVGPYSLDFYCPEFRLVIELDGATHDSPEAQEKDIHRTEFLNKQNVRVVRFQNKDVLSNLDGVVHDIEKYLTRGLPPRPDQSIGAPLLF